MLSRLPYNQGDQCLFLILQAVIINNIIFIYLPFNLFLLYKIFWLSFSVCINDHLCSMYKNSSIVSGPVMIKAIVVCLLSFQGHAWGEDWGPPRTSWTACPSSCWVNVILISRIWSDWFSAFMHALLLINWSASLPTFMTCKDWFIMHILSMTLLNINSITVQVQTWLRQKGY